MSLAIVWGCLIVLLALVFTARARARRRQADRWAAMFGMERFPHESTEELVRRVAGRARIQ